jgi:putative hemolysin
VDMDGKTIDKILASRLPMPELANATETTDG